MWLKERTTFVLKVRERIKRKKKNVINLRENKHIRKKKRKKKAKQWVGKKTGNKMF